MSDKQNSQVVLPQLLRELQKYPSLFKVVDAVKEMIRDEEDDAELTQESEIEYKIEDKKLFDESKLFNMNCCLPNMCVVIAPTGEAIDIRIADGQLKISINTNTPDTPVVKTEEWEKNRFHQPEGRIYYQKISLPASTRNGV